MKRLWRWIFGSQAPAAMPPLPQKAHPDVDKTVREADEEAALDYSLAAGWQKKFDSTAIALSSIGLALILVSLVWFVLRPNTGGAVSYCQVAVLVGGIVFLVFGFASFLLRERYGKESLKIQSKRAYIRSGVSDKVEFASLITRFI